MRQRVGFTLREGGFDVIEAEHGRQQPAMKTKPAWIVKTFPPKKPLQTVAKVLP